MSANLVGALDVHASYPASAAQAPARRQLDPRFHTPDQARLPPAEADLLDPGQPPLPLGARDQALGRASNVELVPTPTYAQLQLPEPDESHFGPIGEFVVKNADYLDWGAFAQAMAEHIRYRNDPTGAANDSSELTGGCAWPPEP